MLISKKTVLMFFIAVILLTGIFIITQPAEAAPWQLVPACADKSVKPGGCDVCDAIEVGINITKIMLGTLGSAALLVFVYGGVLMATSRGHTDQIQHGKDALTNAVKGVIIVLGSWVVINYGLAIMIQPKLDLNRVSLFGESQPWYKVACNSVSSTIVSCVGKPSGTACGDNMVCDGGASCISECQYQYSANKFSCRSLNSCKGFAAGMTYEDDCGSTIACYKGLCSGSVSGGETNVCCLAP